MRVNSMSETVAAAAAEVSTAAIVRTIVQPQRAREAGAGFSRGEAAAAPTRFALAQADAESDSSTTYSCCYPLSRRQLPVLGRMSERKALAQLLELRDVLAAPLPNPRSRSNFSCAKLMSDFTSAWLCNSSIWR